MKTKILIAGLALAGIAAAAFAWTKRIASPEERLWSFTDDFADEEEHI